MKNHNLSDRSAVSFENNLRWLIYVMCFLVVLCVRMNSVDSTIVKGPLLIFFSSLLLASFVSRVFLRGKFQWHPSGADVIVLLFLLAGSVSTALSWVPFYSLQALELFLAYGVCFFAGTQLFRENDEARQLVQMLVLLSAPVCAFALLQFFFGDSLGIKFDLGVARRVPSTLGNANYLGGFLALIIPLALSQLIDRSAGKRKAGIVGLILMVFVLFLTQARSSIVAAVLATILLITMLRSSRSFVITSVALLFIVSAVVAGGLVPGLTERLADLGSFDESISFSRRIFFWEAGLKAVMSSPLLGYGLGSHELIIQQFRAPDYWINGSEDIVPHAHNEFLEVTVESGFTGLLLFVGIMGIILRNGFLAVRSGSNWKRNTAAGMLCSIIAILVDNLANVSLRQPPVAMVTWLLAGVMVSELFSQTMTPSIALPMPQNRIAALFPMLAWGVLMFFIGRRAFETFDSDSCHLEARLAEGRGRRTVAVEEYKRAALANPGNLVATLDLSLALLKVDQPEEALSTIRGLKRIAPDYPKASLVEAASLLKLNKPEEAKEAIQGELNIRHHPEVYHIQSVILLELKDTAGARIALEKILTQNVRAGSQINLDDACTNLLVLARSADDYRRLRDHLQNVVAMFPANHKVSAIMAEVDRRMTAENLR